MEVDIENKNGYKKTKLGWIPDDWEICELGDFIDFKNGVNAGKDDFDSGVKFVNVMDVFNNSYLTNEKISGVVNLDDNSIKANKLLYGDVLFNRTSETREDIARVSVYLDHETSVFGGFVIRGRFLSELLTHEYKKYAFQSQLARRQIIVKGQGVIRTNIGQKDLQKVLLSFPIKMEQDLISTCLGTWDNVILKLTVLIDEKRLQKKALMKQLLTGKKRLTGFDIDWETRKLGEYFSERKERGLDNLRLLSIGEAGVYPQSDSNKKDTSNKDKSQYKRICVGDIGYNSMRMWQGRSALAGMEGMVSPAYTIVKPLENADSVFFSYLFKLDEMIHRFYRHSQGMVSDTWMCKFKDFKKVKFNAPPSKEEQKAIANVLLQADKEITLLNKKLLQLKEQKKGLMQQLLTGKKRLKF